MTEADIAGNDLSIPRSARQQTRPRKQDIPFGVSTPTEDSSLSDKSLTSLLNGKPYLGAPNLPLTPPSLPAESTVSQDTRQSASPRMRDERPEATDETPALQIDTPTPNVTPSRAVALLRKQGAQNTIYLSMSSREESFTTAKEAQSSDEDKGKMSPATLHVPKQRSPRSDTFINAGGKGSTSGSGHSTLKNDTTGVGEMLESRSLDGRREAGREKSSRGPGKCVEGTNQAKPLGDGDKVPISLAHQERNLHKEIQDTQVTDSDPVIQQFAKDIGWLDSHSQQQHGEAAESQNRRLSVASGNSTITIEAIVIEVPQQKRRTLRHMRKNESLRSSSLPVPRPQDLDLTHADSTRPQRRLSHKSVRLSNQDRGSILSDTSIDMNAASHRRKPKEEVIPVVVIPQRRSSLKGSARCSRDHSLTRSIKSTRRPTTAPNGATASFDIAQRRPRALSESLPTRPKDLRAEFRKRGFAAPHIPARRSSLSAPTSRNHSRAVSLTSNTQPFHPHPHEPSLPLTDLESQKAPEPASVMANTSGALEGPPLVSQTVEQHAYAPHIDDNAGNYSPLLPSLTPFQPSIQSLSPGPIEISEARAVPFFAHNNQSIIIVEQSQPTSSRTHQSIRSQAPLRLNTDETVTPPTEMANTAVHSPLRNPRPPPNPPVMSSTYPRRDPTGQGQSQDMGTIGRRWGSLRRAISLKKQSELPPSITVHRVRNPKAGKEIDDKQQAFWNPRPFWDDVKDFEPSNPTTDRQQDTKNDNTFVGNSLGIPQSKVFLQAPISLIRRVSSRARTQNTRPMNVSHVSLSSSVLSRRSRRNKHYIVPRLNLRLPRYPLKDMHDWMVRIRRQREERKLEARRDELRKKIGGLVPIDNNNQYIGATRDI